MIFMHYVYCFCSINLVRKPVFILVNKKNGTYLFQVNFEKLALVEFLISCIHQEVNFLVAFLLKYSRFHTFKLSIPD